MNNIDFIFIESLKELKVSLSSNIILNELRLNQNYPSLASIKEIANKLNIKTDAFKLTSLDREYISTPFITQINKPEISLIKVNDIDFDEKIIRYISNENFETQESFDIFLQKWSGVILTFSKPYKISSRLKEAVFFLKFFVNNKKVLLITLAILLFSLFGISSVNLLFKYKLILEFNIISLLISGYLYVKENLLNNSFNDNYCRINKLFDCDKVANSGKGKLFNLIGFAEIGIYKSLFYMLLILANSNNHYYFLQFFLFLFSSFGVPIMLYSIFQQVFRIKAFCIYCLIIVFLNLSEFLLLLDNLRIPFLDGVSTLNGVYISISICLTLFLFFNLLKKHLTKGTENLLNSKNWFLMKKGIFSSILSNLTIEEDLINFKDKISISKHSNNLTNITIIINTSCIHCKKLVLEINKLLIMQNYNLDINVIFQSNEENNIKLIEIYMKEGFKVFWDSLLKFIDKGEINLSNKIQDNSYLINSQVAFCEKIEVNEIPRFYFNYKRVPNIVYNNNIKLASILNDEIITR